MIEITPDILYHLFKDIPPGISPYGHNIFEPDIDYSENMSDYSDVIGFASCEFHSRSMRRINDKGQKAKKVG